MPKVNKVKHNEEDTSKNSKPIEESKRKIFTQEEVDAIIRADNIMCEEIINDTSR